MKDFLWLIISPSKSFDKIVEHPFSNKNQFLIYTVASCFVFFPKMVEAMIYKDQIITVITYLIAIPLSYIFMYPAAYVFKIVCQGFRGKISFEEMKLIIVLSLIPLALKTIILMPFVLLKMDISIIDHGNYFTSLIFWLLSFRILIVGIAKYNKFNWMISLFVWAISITIIAGFGYIFSHFKNSYNNPLITKTIQ